MKLGSIPGDGGLLGLTGCGRLMTSTGERWGFFIGMKRASKLLGQWSREVPLEGMRGYILARQKPGGGFGLTPHLPASVEDTYYCVRALELMGEAGGVKFLASYLDCAPPMASSPARVLFQQAYLRRWSGITTHGLEEALATRLRRPPVLFELHYSLRAAGELGGQAELRLRKLIRRKTQGLAAQWRTVRDLWHLLSLRNLLGLPQPQDFSSDWLLACRNSDGGFGFLPGTTSFLENGFHALRAMELLGLGLERPDECALFILACRTRSGGFGRINGAVPSPETTFMALDSLRLLGVISHGTHLPRPLTSNFGSALETWKPTAS